MNGLLDRVRESCSRVTECARHVRIDETAFDAWLETVASETAPDPGDPAHLHRGDDDTTLAYVLTLDALNFGSGWFPVLHKRPGASGYFHVAGCLADHFDREGPWSAQDLVHATPDTCAHVFEQSGNAAVAEFMELFARSLGDLGTWLCDRHGGSFATAVASAGGSAERLATSLSEMPLYRDVARHGDLKVAFYKRAQITASDLAHAFEGEGPGRFTDLDRLTIFADNLVPHVLRRLGVLAYTPELASHIDRGELLEPGSAVEVEIRAAAVTSVERAVARLRERGVPATASVLDQLLWSRGQSPEMKAHPRHRTRSPFY